MIKEYYYNVEFNNLLKRKNINKKTIEKYYKETNNIEEKRVIEYTIKYIFDNPNYNEIKNRLLSLKENELYLAFSIINKMNLNIDYDDVLVNFVPSWLKWYKETYKNEENYIEYNIDDVKSFYIFQDWQNKFNEMKNNKINLFDFFKINDVYTKEINLKEGAKEFIEEIKYFNFKKYYILTATVTGMVDSKQKHIEENFNIPKNNVIYATDKANAGNFTFGILIDDGEHNVISVVEQNPFAFAFLVDYSHNRSCSTNKRIKRIYNLTEIMYDLPNFALQMLERIKRPDLIQELYFPKELEIKENKEEKKHKNIKY